MDHWFKAKLLVCLDTHISLQIININYEFNKKSMLKYEIENDTELSKMIDLSPTFLFVIERFQRHSDLSKIHARNLFLEVLRI